MVPFWPLPLDCFVASHQESNCLKSQEQGPVICEIAACQGVEFLRIALSIVSSLRMHAVSATFLGFPAASRR